MFIITRINQPLPQHPKNVAIIVEEVLDLDKKENDEGWQVQMLALKMRTILKAVLKVNMAKRR